MNRKNIKAFSLLSMLLALAFFVAIGQGWADDEEYDEDAYGPADPIVWTKPVKAVVFTHRIHTLEAGLECDSCHDELFEMAAGTAEENEDFTMQSIYDGKYCGACHDGDTAFASNTRCTICHIGVKGLRRLTGAAQEGGEHGGGH